MTETLPWIADFVQQCVSSYLGEGAPKPIKVHDDGSKLTFKVNDLTEKANIHTVCPSLAHLSCKIANSLPSTSGDAEARVTLRS